MIKGVPPVGVACKSENADLADRLTIEWTAGPLTASVNLDHQD
jgi:hypothetical protein